MASRTISAKIPSELDEQIGLIARIEKRSSSNVVRLAIEHYVNAYFDLHPRFREDILEARSAVQKGDVEDYEFG